MKRYKRTRNENPERQALREMMSVILEGALDGELDEELGYSKYDYRNKDTDNSRNGYSRKTMHTRYGDMELDIPRDRNTALYYSSDKKLYKVCVI